MNHTARALLCLSILASLSTPSVAEAQQALAFLEEIPSEQKTAYPGTEGPFSTWIRLAFKFEQGKWISLGNKSMPDEDLKPLAEGSHQNEQWIAFRHGKVVGKVLSGGAQKNDRLSDFGLLPVQAKSALPDLGPRREDYGGWFGIAVHQPLVLLREQCAADPGGWKRLAKAKVPRGAAAALKAADSKRYDGEIPEDVGYSDKDFEVSQAYKSRSGERIIGLKFPDNSPLLEEDFANGYLYWFVVSKGTPRFVGGGMIPLDWADYDNDGHTEFVFKVSRYNEDGYALLCHKLSETVEFTWGYH